jgi:diguanylate cyclase (GGDEF)-like protein
VRASIGGHTFHKPDGETFTVTISIGVTTFDPAQDSDPQRMSGAFLIAQADKALYAAKEAGRNRVVSTGNIRQPEEWPMYA